MNPLSWLHTLETQAFAFGSRLLTDERSDLAAEVERTVTALHHRSTVVRTCRAALREACSRLLAEERRTANLEQAVKACTVEADRAGAVERAVELEQAREALAEVRGRVQQLQQAYVNHQTEQNRLEARLAELQARLHPC